ncbi:MAG TPA: sialidase [Thermoanaerobaculia bacterium]|nr:sialidase [Thermoanaerobaculia bacterium]
MAKRGPAVPSWPAALAALFLSSAALLGAAPAKTPTPPAGAGEAKAGAEAKKPAGPFENLRFRFIGPPGNRVSAVVGVPGDLNTYYAGAASGGVWKSSDAGVHWRPIFDEQSAQSIGSIAIAPSDPNVVWVGTGEPFIRSNVSLGDGIYKSIDAGKTWTRMGLEKTGRIGRIAINPHNPDIVFAAALGTCYGPQQERGVYRTTDGGKTWTRVLFVDENTGISDLSMDPVDPSVLYAGAWPIVIHTWGRNSGGTGGVYVSRDGGTTWKHLSGHGLPEPPLGKIAVSVAPSRHERVYALIETGDRGSLWRSDDAGENWKLVNHSRLLNERPHYYTRMLVMPDNANEVYFPDNGMGATYDGGETSEEIPWGGDNHDMWSDPKNANRMMIGNDGGVLISTTRGKEWTFLRLPIGQMYHVTTDNRIPYFVYAQMQDDGSMRGPSNSLGYGITPAHWTSTAGCETGWATPDPVDANIVWGGCYAGVVERWDAKTGMAQSVSPWPERTMGGNAGEVKLRMNWTFPIAISPHDHNTVYVGSQYVHATSDGGNHWKAISPDLTLNDKSMMGDSGGLTVDNLSVEYAGVVYSIAESPKEKGVIWAGTNDGLVQVTRDGGAHWDNVAKNMPNLPPKGTVDSVDPSPHDGGTCYVSVDFHQVDNRDPYIYKTTDYGKTWKFIAGSIPKSPLSYVHVVREDPFRKGLLYAGTENALYVSFDDGGHWQEFQDKLPHAPVYWLTVQPHFHDLVVGTYGRGIWILDDVGPLEQLTDGMRSDAVHLFEPRPAYRFRRISQPSLAPVGAVRGENPPYGAIVSYWLKEPLAGEGKENKEKKESKSSAGEEDKETKKSPVTITVWNAQGEKIRTLHGTNKTGVNRVTWDLRYEPSEEVRLRLTPPGNPHVFEEKRFRGKDYRGVYYYGITALRNGPLVAPGTYTVRLEAGGKQQEQKVVVLKDPNSAGTETSVAESTKFSVAIWRDTTAVARMINRLEWTRRQLQDFQKMLQAEKASEADLKAAKDLGKSVGTVEDDLLQPTIEEADQKSFRGPLKLYLWLLWLQAEAGPGAADVSGNADMAPTEPQRQVYELLSGRLADARKRVETLYSTTIPAWNETMRTKGYVQLMDVKEPEGEPAPSIEEEDEDGSSR